MSLQGIEVEGIIIKEYPAKEGVSNRTGNPWKSQEFVIQTKDQYPEPVFSGCLEQIRSSNSTFIRVITFACG